jgi:hypothetical protein
MEDMSSSLETSQSLFHNRRGLPSSAQLGWQYLQPSIDESSRVKYGGLVVCWDKA